MITLYPHQERGEEALREGIRSGHRVQLVSAPTGSGKTVIGAHLLQQALNKDQPAVFVVDRVALADQTSQTLWKYGIRHGVAQGKNTFGRSEPIQVCSAQTLEKRGFFPNFKLLIVDEAHTLRKQTVELIQNCRFPVVGLTATPFTKGLGNVYSNVVNVATTNQLIANGYLAPLRVYAATEIDMTGAKVVAGEWTDREVERRGKEIVGDIVTEWEKKTFINFGGPVKTIAFSATVDHGAEICRQFQAAGYDFRQISYKDGNDERRTKLIEAFRRGEVMGLVSCEALAKGFDVPDILCLICARPYRKSLSSHIQMIGRGMRSAPGKEFCLLLDHSGNYLGFFDQMEEFFEHGVSKLSDEGLDNTVREEKAREKKELVCSCGYVMKPSMDSCPACGKERLRMNKVVIRPGQLVSLGDEAMAGMKPHLRDSQSVWGQLCAMGIERKKDDIEAARKFAMAQYMNIYGSWPRTAFAPSESIDPKLRGTVQHNIIKWIKRGGKDDPRRNLFNSGR